MSWRRNLRDRFRARCVSFLFVDVVGRRMLRVSDTGGVSQEDRAEQVPLADSGIYDEVLRTQELVRVPKGTDGHRVLAPVTNRGDTIGVELFLHQVTEDTLVQVEYAAHALAYIIVTDRRFTDLYHWGNRTTTVSLSAEIQRQLLPSAPSCESAEFALAGALVPASDIAGDTYDYSLDNDVLHLSITDAMGHDVNASLLATLAVNASRGARRAGTDLAEQARQLHHALLDHGRRTFTTGQLLRIALDGTSIHIVNAGHPCPLSCAAAPSAKCPWRSTCPLASPSRAPIASKSLTCAPATAFSSIPTACRNVTRTPSTCPHFCARPRPSIPGRSCALWSPRSPTPTTVTRPRTTPPSCAWTGTAQDPNLPRRTADPPARPTAVRGRSPLRRPGLCLPVQVVRAESTVG